MGIQQSRLAERRDDGDRVIASPLSPSGAKGEQGCAIEVGGGWAMVAWLTTNIFLLTHCSLDRILGRGAVRTGAVNEVHRLFGAVSAA